ncbi:MAG: hypothetical protein NTW99_11455 [Chloroflexi bacterium]|nr:hypothetical protein [Chloroflexota bacterium]
MKKITVLISQIVMVVVVLTACGGNASKPKDMLAQINSRGYVIVSTDPNYAPQSSLNTQGKRPSTTKCPSDTLTTAEMQGFDVDVAAEIGKRLGVEGYQRRFDDDHQYASQSADLHCPLLLLLRSDRRQK